ncbi:Uncharacterized protein CLAVI_000625 [Candidatus Clavichlamydia salmonicola]|uniref:ABC transporter substrate-binding protein n=1 Tax=Candidatus Clavichlamydia salmonicola TaxID=469812 RepID=UPI001890EDCD|nr:ABC transporter substrate-binding protein [Candidatus Clavichlamydia salmonicola]MBF5051001.1 Uncharacterized protein [Candidatus Clavichlamydia salmonicola]
MKRLFYLIFSCMSVLCLIFTYSFIKKTEQRFQKAEASFIRIHDKLEKILIDNKPITIGALPIKSQDIGDPTYPNLLQKDPFFSNILPSLLGNNFHPKGVLRTSIPYRPDNLYFFGATEHVYELYELCGVKLGKVQRGCRARYTSEGALKIERHISEEPGCIDFVVYLRKDLFWEPLNPKCFPSYAMPAPIFFKRHPVVAQDYKLFYDCVVNPNIFGGRATAWRAFCKDLVAVKVIDNHKIIVRWKAHKVKDEDGSIVERLNFMAEHVTMAIRPIPFFIYAYNKDGTKIIEDDHKEDTYCTNSVWAQHMTMHWALNYVVSCGPYVFREFSDDRIVLERNAYYFNPIEALVEKRIIRIREGAETAFTDFKAEEIDIALLPGGKAGLKEFMQSKEYKAQKEAGHAIEQFHCYDRNFTHIGWNCQHPLFSSEVIRQALSMAVDKQKIINAFLNGQAVPVTGPFFHASSYADSTVQDWPFDTDRAQAMLENEGWIKDPKTGVRTKIVDGQLLPFSFRLSYLVKNQQMRVIADYLSEAFWKIGVDCQPYGLDVADINRVFDDKVFDAILYSWKLRRDPLNPRIYWYSKEALAKGSGNMCGFIDPEADRLIELINYEEDFQKLQTYYHKLHRLIHQKAPYTFLFSQNKDIVYRESIKNIFVPAMKQDLFPGSEEYDVDIRSIWMAP